MPAAVLLAKAAKQWQEQHDGKLPGSYPERAAFKDMIRSWQRHIDGIPLEVREGVCGCVWVWEWAAGWKVCADAP